MPRHGHMGPGGANEKAKDFKGTLKKLLHYMSVFKVQMAFDCDFCNLWNRF